MVHRLLAAVGCLLLGVQLVDAHGYMASIRISDRTYIGNPFPNLAQTIANGSAVRPAPPDKGYTDSITDPNMACGSAGTGNGTVAHYPAMGGDVVTMTMTLFNNTIPWPHKTCVLSTWMAECPSSPTGCTNVNASTLSWFPIRKDGITSEGYWPIQVYGYYTDFRTDGIGAGPEYYTILPQGLASGYYLLRYETDCLFDLYTWQEDNPEVEPGDPEFYPWCVQLNFTSNGTQTPSGIQMNEAYQANEFSNIQNTSAAIAAWPMPGPPVVSLSMDAATKSYDNDPSTGYYNYNGSSWTHSTSDSNAYNDTISCSNDPAATYAFAFVGTGFSLLFGTASNRGQFDVAIDGVSLGTVGSANMVTGEAAYSLQYQNTSLALGVHTVVVSQGGQNIYLCNDLVQVNGGMLPATRLSVLLSPRPPMPAPSSTSGGPPSASPTSSASGGGTNIGAIAGGAAGGAVAVIAVVVLLFFCLRRRRASRARDAESPESSVDAPRKAGKMDLHDNSSDETKEAVAALPVPFTSAASTVDRRLTPPPLSPAKDRALFDFPPNAALDEQQGTQASTRIADADRAAIVSGMSASGSEVHDDSFDENDTLNGFQPVLVSRHSSVNTGTGRSRYGSPNPPGGWASDDGHTLSAVNEDAPGPSRSDSNRSRGSRPLPVPPPTSATRPPESRPEATIETDAGRLQGDEWEDPTASTLPPRYDHVFRPSEN